MSDQTLPYKTFQEKNNGLSAAQEVLYQKGFKQADRVAEKTRKQWS